MKPKFNSHRKSHQANYGWWKARKNCKLNHLISLTSGGKEAVLLSGCTVHWDKIGIRVWWRRWLLSLLLNSSDWPLKRCGQAWRAAWAGGPSCAPGVRQQWCPPVGGMTSGRTWTTPESWVCWGWRRAPPSVPWWVPALSHPPSASAAPPSIGTDLVQHRTHLTTLYEFLHNFSLWCHTFHKASNSIQWTS